MSRFFILDERDVWHRAAMDAAKRAGYYPKRIYSGDIDISKMQAGDVGFIRPHADWRQLPKNHDDDAVMRRHLLMIQDRMQVEHYEDKWAQTERWGEEWMPPTWLCEDIDAAMSVVEHADYPLVSKAKVGASSVNVRILRSKSEARDHVRRLFGPGIAVHHGANCPDTLQRGYAILQDFIPHRTTYRVNAIGNARAVFFRYCYPDKPVAQTGNVEPCMEMTEEIESLIAYADAWFAKAGTRWCAIDVLKDKATPMQPWRLLETSLAWPWPSPGRCNDGTIFRASKPRKWIDIFDVMFDELGAGAWASAH